MLGFKIAIISICWFHIASMAKGDCFLRSATDWDEDWNSDNKLENFMALSCYNTSADDYVDEFLELEVSYQEIANIRQLTIKNSEFYHIDFLTNPYEILAKNVYQEYSNNLILGLTLKFCKINFIEPKAFMAFDKLNEIDLGFNAIEDITFVSNLPGVLTKLNLTNNAITNIDFWLFSDKIIEFLDLSFNRLTHFSMEIEGRISPFLQDIKCLYLNNNYISKIQWNSDSLYSWTQINLAFNNITIFEYNKYYEGIRQFERQLLDLSESIADLAILANITETATRNLILTNNKIYKLEDLNFEKHLSIDFSNSSLTSIHNTSFQVTRDVSLNFSHNNLKIINGSMFSGDAINVLDLAFNEIDNLSSIFWYPKIYKLNLSSNKFTQLNFNSLEVTNLDLSFNNIKLNNNSFHRLVGLEQLNLASNNMTEIQEFAFNNLDTLKYLHLNNNSLKSINLNIFKPLLSIQEINLSYNQLKILESNIFSNLPVRSINLSGNNIKDIRANAFCNLSKIHVISINHNKCQINIEKFSFSNLSDLFEINLKYSKISKINLDIFSNVSNINVLDVRGNNITSYINNSHNMRLRRLYITLKGKLETKSFIQLKFLETLKFFNSNITSIDIKAFHGLVNLQNLEFENSKIGNLEIGALDGLFSVRKIDLQSILKNKSSLNSYMFRNLHSLQNLNLSNLKLEIIMPNAFQGLRQLKKLDLSNNTLDVLKRDDFRGLSNLQTLNLNANNINNIELGALQNFPLLDLLLLANNKLTEFIVGIFSNLSLLKTLDLQKNKITSLLFETFLPLKSLEYLNLEFNNLKSIGHFLPMILNLSKLKRIAINNNKWKCENLAKIIVNFKKYNVNYTSEHLNFYDNNIEGIDCIDVCKYLLCLKDSHGIN